jgi:hypothetical protein
MMVAIDLTGHQLGRLRATKRVRMPEDKEGYLRMQPSGRWAVVRFGCEPVEITSAELFRGVVNGGLQVRRMEYGHGHDARGYYAVGGPELRNGTRAAISSGE